MRGSLLLLAAALAACRAPAPGPAAGAVALRLDGGRMLGDVALLAHDSMEGRGAGTAGGARARRWLLAEFGRIGLAPGAGFEQRFALEDGREGVNLVGTIPGRTRPDRVLLLSAHYDHLGTRGGEVYNGADDDASGVAAVLELARRFRAHPPASTLVVALFDAEERGTEGSAALVRAPRVPLDRVAAVVNLDMVGRNAAGELWIAGPAHWPKLGPVAEVAAARSSLRVRLGHDRPGRDDWTFASDHGPFHRAGVPFLYFGEEDHPDYHRTTDDVERIQPAFLHAAAETVLDALLVLDTLQAPVR